MSQNGRMSEHEEDQEEFDAVFSWIVENEENIDDVIRKLKRAGVEVEDEQRPIVNHWLDGLGSNTKVPLPLRVMILTLWLRR